MFTRAGIVDALGNGTCAERLARLEGWLDSRTPPAVPRLRIQDDVTGDPRLEVP